MLFCILIIKKKNVTKKVFEVPAVFYFSFLFYFQLCWDVIDLCHCICLTCIICWFDTFINHKMMATIMSATTSILSHMLVAQILPCHFVNYIYIWLPHFLICCIWLKNKIQKLLWITCCLQSKVLTPSSELSDSSIYWWLFSLSDPNSHYYLQWKPKKPQTKQNQKSPNRC